MEEATCLACFAPLLALGRRDGSAYGCCRSCGSVQLLDVPDEASLTALYADSYHQEGHYHESAEEHRRTRDRVCRQVLEAVLAGRDTDESGLVVELGAGWGSLARLFVERGVPYLGIEPNDVMVASAAREGLPVILGAVSTLADTATVGDDVDCIVSMAVFEHLSEPESALRLMGQTVKPGGRVVVQCPTAGIPRTMGGLAHHLFPDRDLPSFFGSLAPPWHVLLPSPRGMGSMAARCGLDIIEVSTSRSGRARGARQVLQRINEAVALVGSRSFGESWPLTMAHLFVLERPRA